MCIKVRMLQALANSEQEDNISYGSFKILHKKPLSITFKICLLVRRHLAVIMKTSLILYFLDPPPPPLKKKHKEEGCIIAARRHLAIR